MDLPTDFDCSVHIQLRFGGNHIFFMSAPLPAKEGGASAFDLFPIKGSEKVGPESTLAGSA
jgi:hypothetical protein